MYGHIYIKRNEVTFIYKSNAYDAIYDRLSNMGYEHESAEDISNWAEQAAIGSEYITDNQDEIYIEE